MDLLICIYQTLLMYCYMMKCIDSSYVPIEMFQLLILWKLL